MGDAYVCRVTEENMPAIASEFGKGWDRDKVVRWLEVHEEGYFLRDPSSVLDCNFFVPAVFYRMYMFENDDTHALFRRVLRL